jgi:hypothetical protein
MIVFIYKLIFMLINNNIKKYGVHLVNEPPL